MNQELFIAVMAGLGGMLGWGTADFFAKKSIDKIGAIRSLFWAQLLGILPLLLLLALGDYDSPFSNSSSIYSILALGFFSAVSYIPAYIAFGKGKLSLISPVFASYSALVVLLSAIILKQTLTPSQTVAILIVILGILLISTNPKELLHMIRNRSRGVMKGLPEILVAVLSYSIWLIALYSFLNNKDWVPILLLIRVFATLTLGTYLTLKSEDLFFKDKEVWKFLPIIGLFDVGAFASVSWGYSNTEQVAIITVLTATFSIPTIILARIFLKEKVSIYQTIASAIIILGIVLVTLG